jgi:hypothetical protein
VRRTIERRKAIADRYEEPRPEMPLQATRRSYDKKVWFITGAGRFGMGVSLAETALPVKESVIATGITKEAQL